MWHSPYAALKPALLVLPQMPKIDISEDDAPLIIRALEHYHAYLAATQGQDDRYMQLAKRLKRKGRLG